MHDGRFKTLRQVIEYYEDPSLFVKGSINIDTTLAKPLGLTEKEKQQLEAFLLTLTDKRFRKN
jgi:cytochrome c peroxidase